MPNVLQPHKKQTNDTLFFELQWKYPSSFYSSFLFFAFLFTILCYEINTLFVEISLFIGSTEK